jgi:hypothetical protein
MVGKIVRKMRLVLYMNFLFLTANAWNEEQE